MYHLNKKLILASQSPRRKQLLKESGFDFDVITTGIDEIIDPKWPIELTAQYLSEQKATACLNTIDKDNRIILAADTIVVLDNKLLGKPENRNHAIAMLRELSGKQHKVYTGICFEGVVKHVETVLSLVEFDTFDNREIEFYIDNCKPYDKAGSYGVQEWLGHCKIKHIEGSFTNIMGLPMHQVYNVLKRFII
jgi:septum formation protein